MAQVSLRESGIDLVTHASAVFWASSSSESVLAALKSRPAGLSQAETRARLLHYGPNALPPAARRRWYLQLASNFVNLFAVLLWVGAFLA